MRAAGQVSVALASFNGEEYLGEQLRSILEQSRPPDEIVLSDGGSQDGTVDLAREILSGVGRGIRAQVIADGARLGVAANFQRAIAATRGEFVALSDQDDRWHPDRLARGESLMKDPAVMLAASNARLVAADGSPLGWDLFEALGVGASELARLRGPDAFALLLRRNLVTGATVMFRRALFDTARPFPPDWVHDEWLTILAAASGRIEIDVEPLIDYRQHGANQIGVRAPTIRYRIRRMLEPRGDRYRTLARRSGILAERLAEFPTQGRFRELAGRKAHFERVRAEYGARRLSRVAPVIREWRSGSYRELSSQGTFDVARDLLQPD